MTTTRLNSAIHFSQVDKVFILLDYDINVISSLFVAFLDGYAPIFSYADHFILVPSGDSKSKIQLLSRIKFRFYRLCLSYVEVFLRQAEFYPQFFFPSLERSVKRPVRPGLYSFN